MSSLRQAVSDYLSVRRALGYKLARHARLLPQFVDYLHSQAATVVTVDHALTWAMQPQDASPRWWAERLSIVRTFATWLVAIEPATQIPPHDLLPCPRQRAVPFLYSEQQLEALLEAAEDLRPAWKATTHHTLLGLLIVTGMRIGEALALDVDDLHLSRRLLIVRHGKFDKARELALHASTVEALDGYLAHRNRRRPESTALFVTATGTRLAYRTVSTTFRRLVQQAGLEARSRSCRPRLHDLRHTFAVNALLDAYRGGDDVHARMPLLSTWLGHTDPTHTYWYLSAAPELLALAGQRLDSARASRR